MKSLFVAASLAACAVASAAEPAKAPPKAPLQAQAPVQTRNVPINDFMQGRLPLQIPVNLPVPVEYELAKIKRIGYSYWMKPADAVSATPEKLPGRNGYMVGSTATSVTYDPAHKVFYGIDDPGSLNKLKTAATNIQVKRFSNGNHPAVMVSMTSATTGQPAYFMYMSTGKKKDVFFISLRAPDGKPEVGDAIWAKLAASLTP